MQGLIVIVPISNGSLANQKIGSDMLSEYRHHFSGIRHVREKYHKCGQSLFQPY